MKPIPMITFNLVITTFPACRTLKKTNKQIFRCDQSKQHGFCITSMTLSHLLEPERHNDFRNTTVLSGLIYTAPCTEVF